MAKKKRKKKPSPRELSRRRDQSISDSGHAFTDFLMRQVILNSRSHWINKSQNNQNLH